MKSLFKYISVKTVVANTTKRYKQFILRFDNKLLYLCVNDTVRPQDFVLFLIQTDMILLQGGHTWYQFLNCLKTEFQHSLNTRMIMLSAVQEKVHALHCISSYTCFFYGYGKVHLIA